ncbi:hypothetical protein [Oceanobacillus profundus]|uniref:Uncharacterized protein n=1 Tax=Oceanobacillus profundus TaxID=372463 RepID=A0A417YJJ0_9BACI|nr:hypothetical protein [Oceanobacillus profundus]MBR3121372.1 hypothetical protein [Oceanobacillus sp.]PAE31062.1 hypothetical protein CHI07_00610 [Paenibacillus sp. 7884-2]MCM3396860.1 hypothetical protein [Oceanobacillus profundus]MDO6448160.1 hypothetical protein [Oceanobacillus profundus]RHW33150.1 hypothetical protein D1B32_08890 [Oceanobacillus profundus]
MGWIFDNLFIIIIIISGIIGFFNNSNEKQKQQEKEKKKAPPQRPGRTVSEGTRTPERKPQPVAEQRVYREERSRDTVSTASIAEQQKQQMEKLASKYSTISNSKIEDLKSQADSGSILLEPEKETSKKQERLKKQVVGNLGAKGLVNGIIMSEILGPPRAKKSYKNVLDDRIK